MKKALEESHLPVMECVRYFRVKNIQRKTYWQLIVNQYGNLIYLE